MSIARLALALLSSVSLAAIAHAAFAADAPAAPASDQVTEVTGVVVTAPREEVKARKLQQDAINVINVQSAETIEKYPDFNAAEALGRIPGVSMSVDTGEGRYVNIRGIDSNLDGATFGGVPLLNDDPGGVNFGGGGRAVNFDTVPVGSVDGIILTKTLTPDHDAEGLGGTIELTPRTATNITAPFADVGLGWGYEDERDRTGPFNADLAVGARFGFANGHMIVEGRDDTSGAGLGWVSNPTPFSFVLTASRMDDFRGFDDIEEDYTPNAAGTAFTPVYQDLQLRRYNYHRRRFGYGGEFDYKPNDDHSYYFRANVAGYIESVDKNRLTYDFSSYTPTPDPTHPGGYDSPADLSIKSTDEQETHRNQVFILGGTDKFGGVVIDYHTSYSRATFNQGYDFGTTFNGPTVQTYFNNSQNKGDFPVIQVTDGTNINDGSLYSLKKGNVSNQQQVAVDEEYTTAGNVTVPAHFIADDAFKAGFQLRFRDKDSSEWDETDHIGSGTLALNSFGVPAFTDFYGNRYTNGPGVNTVLTGSLAGAIDPGASPATFNPSAYFQAHEDVYAGYAMYTTKIQNWQFMAGVRIEDTEAKYGAYDDQNNFVTSNQSYVNVFPTVQGRYNFSPDALVRFTWSTGISRPGFEQNTPAAVSNGDPTNPQITQGNPNLKPTTGNNFDLSFEYYLPKGGILQFGLFDKEFRNYIVTDYAVKTDTDPTSQFFQSPVGYTTFSNIPSAYARGAEIAYHQQFLFLPGFWSGFGTDANLTLVDSRIEEYDAAIDSLGHAEYGLLPGTSRVTWNLAGFYEKYGFEARLAAEYVSKELFTLSGFQGSQANGAMVDKAADTIQDDRLSLDYSMSYKVTPTWKLYFQAKNLTNAPLRFYVTNPSLPIQREFYDQTFLFGVKAKF